MQPVTNTVTLTFGILLNLGVIALLLWFAQKMMNGKSPEQQLFILATIGFIIFVGIYLADKLTFINRSLLNDSESTSIFTMTNSLLSAIVGYYLKSIQTPKI